MDRPLWDRIQEIYYSTLPIAPSERSAFVESACAEDPHLLASGGLKEYWDIFYSGTNAQGAFVWDWVDQTIRVPVPGEYAKNTDAKTFLAYGGWWENKTIGAASTISDFRTKWGWEAHGRLGTLAW